MIAMFISNITHTLFTGVPKAVYCITIECEWLQAAIECISDDLRRMLKPKGVWVSEIEPGFVVSGMCTGPQCQSSTAATTTTPAIMHALTDGHPLTRYLLCSDREIEYSVAA